MTLDALFASMGLSKPTIGVGYHVLGHQGEMYRGVSRSDAVGWWVYRRNRRRAKPRDCPTYSLDLAAFYSMRYYGPGWTWELFDGSVEEERPRLYCYLYVRTDSCTRTWRQPVYERALMAALQACHGARPDIQTVVCAPGQEFTSDELGQLWEVHEVMLVLAAPREELRFVSVQLTPDARLTVGAIAKALDVPDPS